MSLTVRILLAAITGYILGFLVGRPAFGTLIGILSGSIVPLEKYLKNTIFLGTVGLFLLLVILPPILSLIGIVFLTPLALSFNLISSEQSSKKRGEWVGFRRGPEVNEAMVRLLAGLISTDPVLRRRQLEAVKHFISRNTADFNRQLLWEAFQDSLGKAIEVGELTRLLKESTSFREQKFFLRFLVEFASISDGMTPEEKQYVRDVANQLEISRQAVERILDNVRESRWQRGQGRWSHSGNGQGGRKKGRTVQKGNLREAYDVLGLSPSAAPEEVKKAYQRKVKKYHPDRYRNEDEKQVEEAEEKMAEINQAYRTIKKQW